MNAATWLSLRFPTGAYLGDVVQRGLLNERVGGEVNAATCLSLHVGPGAYLWDLLSQGTRSATKRTISGVPAAEDVLRGVLCLRNFSRSALSQP